MLRTAGVCWVAFLVAACSSETTVQGSGGASTGGALGSGGTTSGGTEQCKGGSCGGAC